VDLKKKKKRCSQSNGPLSWRKNFSNRGSRLPRNKKKKSKISLCDKKVWTHMTDGEVAVREAATKAADRLRKRDLASARASTLRAASARRRVETLRYVEFARAWSSYRLRSMISARQCTDALAEYRERKGDVLARHTFVLDSTEACAWWTASTMKMGVVSRVPQIVPLSRREPNVTTRRALQCLPRALCAHMTSFLGLRESVSLACTCTDYQRVHERLLMALAVRVLPRLERACTNLADALVLKHGLHKLRSGRTPPSSVNGDATLAPGAHNCEPSATATPATHASDAPNPTGHCHIHYANTAKREAYERECAARTERSDGCRCVAHYVLPYFAIWRVNAGRIRGRGINDVASPPPPLPFFPPPTVTFGLPAIGKSARRCKCLSYGEFGYANAVPDPYQHADCRVGFQYSPWAYDPYFSLPVRRDPLVTLLGVFNYVRHTLAALAQIDNVVCDDTFRAWLQKVQLDALFCVPTRNATKRSFALHRNNVNAVATMSGTLRVLSLPAT
jgi:hypothetical protein